VLLKKYFNDAIPDLPDKKLLYSRRLEFLVRACRRVISREEDFGFTLRGRVEKVIYIMRLTTDLKAKADWFFGILIRIIAGRVR
jgi:hypothetical protein